jgi:amidase
LDEIITWTAQETVAAIRARKVSVTEVAKAHLDRIAEIEPDLRAVVDPLNNEALARAEALDAIGPTEDPLHGLPVTIKINVDYRGRPNSNGLPALNQTPCAEDAPVVANFRKGGAVPVGRTSTPEFSLRWFTSNPIYGVTLNPVNRALTPGGSSGGASAGIAAGAGVIGHGNDLGGSLRYPAYCCGLATLKPSMGRVPAFNPSQTAERPAMTAMMSVQGAIARSVGDVRLAMRALVRRDARDPLWNAAVDSGRAPGVPLKVGIVTDPFGDGVHGDVAAAVEKARRAVEAQGAETVDVTPPMVHELATAWCHLLNADTQVMAREMMDQVGSAEVMAVLDAYADIGGLPDMKGYMTAMANRAAAIRAWTMMFETIDALVMPVSAQPPFRLEQDFREPETLRDILMAQRFLYAVNVLGFPSAAVSTGANAGVPMGVQIVGAMRNDDICLDVAEMIERELATRARPVDI